MNSRFEELLKKGMQKLGNGVEAVIGQAKKAKGTGTTKQIVKPILAIESELALPKIKELMGVGVERIITPEIPNLVDKSALEISEGAARFTSFMKEKGAALAVHVDIGASAGSYPKDAYGAALYEVRGTARNIPFENGFFDFVIANLATSEQGDIVKVMQELYRILTLGGEATIVDFHPFGRFAKRGVGRLRSAESIVKGVEDYYKICRTIGFKVNNIKEAFFDETVRNLFESQEEKSSFRSVKDTPFLIFLFVSKKSL